MSRVARRIGTACAIGVVAALLMEAALRLFWPELFPHHVPGLFAPDPELGHVLAPGRVTVIEKPEFQVTVTTNSKGFRGAELTAKGEGGIRILCIGDWLTWGEGVDDHETYPVFVERALRERYPGKQIQLINAGIPQYGPLDELAYLRTIAAELEPDFVIIQFYAGDDFDQNELPARERHEFRDGTLEETERFTSSTGPRWLTTLNRLKHRSHAIHWLSERVGTVVMHAGLLSNLERASSSHFSDEQAARARAVLIEMHTVGDRLGARTLFVFAPEKMQVYARLEPPLRAAAVVADVAQTTGSWFLDLTALLLAHEDVERLYLTTVGTWRSEGYQLAADAVTNEIIALGWIHE
jgi:hypothetical protein